MFDELIYRESSLSNYAPNQSILDLYGHDNRSGLAGHTDSAMASLSTACLQLDAPSPDKRSDDLGLAKAVWQGWHIYAFSPYS